ncbi:hypothetical protein NDU88_006833 [Pleurodeles waltl]|uniref:Uncharacterized protein n=1 Tax=Pleurodeles waltl TaxID=8319 RepID=A0AAV7SQN2_PLEWA|nr:hypothetical protein NDU88_006833 [Pleurodeles waltl]
MPGGGVVFSHRFARDVHGRGVSSVLAFARGSGRACRPSLRVLAASRLRLPMRPTRPDAGSGAEATGGAASAQAALTCPPRPGGQHRASCPPLHPHLDVV